MRCFFKWEHFSGTFSSKAFYDDLMSSKILSTKQLNVQSWNYTECYTCFSFLGERRNKHPENILLAQTINWPVTNYMSKWYQMLNSKEFPKSEEHLWSKQQLWYFKDIFRVGRVLAEAKPFQKKEKNST